VGADEALCFIDGYDPFVSPRIKNTSYLTSGFTIEFNYNTSNQDITLQFPNAYDGHAVNVYFDVDGQVESHNFSKDLNADFSGDKEGFKNKWHHAAFIFKNGTIKCYVDQYRVLVMPNVNFTPTSLQFGGVSGSNKNNPLMFKDVRIASGGNMNLIGKKFTDSKIITHGINFDVDKATIKPESMGTLNMIVKIMNNNPDLKFEVDGHTDNSGDAQHNKALSQQRADAVKSQLVSMGIDASRITTKGFGDTKPISTNDTQDGKATNRRVEFVKI